MAAHPKEKASRRRGAGLATPRRSRRAGLWSDPFELSADLHAYAPRPALEEHLDQLTRCLRTDCRTLTLTGPAGYGKTLLLRTLADRIANEVGVVHLMAGRHTPSELCARALGRMHVLIDSDSVSVFAGCARDLATTGKMLILLLDDATTLDPATTRFLVKLADELDGALRVVFCATDGPEVTSLLEQLPETTQSIRFDEPMSAEEVEDLIDARLAWGRANDELRELFDENTVSQLHAKTGGVPKLVLIAARAIASQSLGSRRPEDPMGRGALRRRIREAQRAGVPLGSARQKPREFWSRVWPSQPGRPDAWWVLFYSLILALGVMALMLARPGNLADEPGLNQGYQRSELPNAQRPSTRDRSLANRP